MEAKIRTLHPNGKQGTNISQAKYEVIKQAILEALQARPGLTFTELTQEIEARLAGNFEGSVNWYVTTVKLDLEARGLVRRVPNTSPQQLRLVSRNS